MLATLLYLKRIINLVFDWLINGAIESEDEYGISDDE